MFEKFKEEFEVKNADSPRNLWRAYAKSVISACKFLAKFESAEDFDTFVERFSYNEFSAAALPMVLEKEIFGFGFPLVCDFLKELGFAQYPKPDVHIKEIFTAFDLCENNDYSAYKAVINMANTVNETAYRVDRIFWLIGSGDFFKDGISIGRKKKDFIEKTKAKEF